MDLLFAAKYPFTTGARSALLESGISMDEDTLQSGYERATVALSTGKLPKIAAELQSALVSQIASYASARMLLLALNNRYLTNRYAVAEAKRASAYLSGESEQNLELLCQELALRFEKNGRQYLLPFPEYLRFNPHSVDYRLSNRKISGGLVQVSPHERIRIMEEAIKARVGKLPDAKVPASVQPLAKKLLLHLPREELATVKLDSSNYPPCIQNMLVRLRMSENLPHTARWTLAVYLLRSGMKPEEIIGLFKNAPDYSEGTTRYQVEYLKQKGYAMPSCVTMDSYGICVARCRCASPVHYRKEKHGRFAEATRTDLQKGEPGTPSQETPEQTLAKKKWEDAKSRSQ
jgi:DNA primase large subunit